MKNIKMMVMMMMMDDNDATKQIIKVKATKLRKKFFPWKLWFQYSFEVIRLMLMEMNDEQMNLQIIFTWNPILIQLLAVQIIWKEKGSKLYSFGKEKNFSLKNFLCWGLKIFYSCIWFHLSVWCSSLPDFTWNRVASKLWIKLDWLADQRWACNGVKVWCDKRVESELNDKESLICLTELFFFLIMASSFLFCIEMKRAWNINTSNNRS